MVIPLETLLEIQNLARLNPKREVCGLVLSDNEVVQITNVSTSPENCFVFSKREYFKALNRLVKEGKSILCVWHSHPGNNAEPSKADLDYVKLSKRNSLIVSGLEYHWIEYAQN
jgi:proteasome lid subunit RPN8/RPN11